MFLPRCFKSCLRISFLVLLLGATSVGAQQRFVIAVVEDGPADRLSWQGETIKNELLTLTEREFDIEFRTVRGDWTRHSIEAAANRAYLDDQVDMVLVTGFVANQILATRASYPKPTFLPIIIDTGLFVSPPTDGRSGIPNLNYISTYADFTTDLETLARITPYEDVVLMVDEVLSSSIPGLRQRAQAASEAAGINLIQVAHDGVNHDLMERVPPEADAVFVAGLARMPDAVFDELVAAVNEAGLPSYSFAGVRDVERGLLVTNSEPRDVARQARLNALNMQAVMIGGRAEDQAIDAPNKDRLTINMATARQIGLSPSFDVLSEAVLLNQDAELAGDQIGLVEIARMAIAQNQDLLAESYGVRAGVEEIARARAGLLPQLNASVTNTTRKESASVSAGLFPERSNDAAISIDQLIYSDAASANLTIQKELQKTRLASLDQFRLDVVQAATTSYYTVLNARSQLRVQDNNLAVTRANLELAQDRVRLGMSTASDLYRWQAEVARARIGVLNARAALNQSWDTLNRILHRPPGSRIALREAGFNEPFVMTRKEFDGLIRSQADYATFSSFYIRQALSQAPELEQLDAQIAAKRRELKSEQRSYWLPTFSVGAQLTENLNQSGAGVSSGEGLSDWNVGIRATLPLFSGGERRANVSRASYELRQLQALRTSTAERVEETVRIQLHAAQAKYVNIDLTQEAAEASKKNFDLVSDAYASGTVNVIELLDAQEASFNASAAAADSLYDFLITIMALQRAVGANDYLLPAAQRDALAERFRQTLSGSSP